MRVLVGTYLDYLRDGGIQGVPRGPCRIVVVGGTHGGDTGYVGVRGIRLKVGASQRKRWRLPLAAGLGIDYGTH